MPRELDDWLKGYLEYTDCLEAPTLMHFWVGVGTVASALRHKVWFDQVRFRWTPNFYIILVAIPGIVNKSTTIRQGQRLIRATKGLRLGPNSLTWQSLVTEMTAAHEKVPIGDGMFKSMSCLTFVASELGSLLNPKDRDMVTLLTDLWDGEEESWRKKVKMSELEEIYNPWINIIAGTTPQWIQDNLPRAMIGGGWSSRCIFIYASKKRKYIAYVEDEIEDPEMDEALFGRLQRDLAQIAALRGQFHLTADAKKFGKEWYEGWWKNPPKALLESREFEGYIARKQTHVHKVAMVLSAAEGNNLRIERRHLENSVAILDEAEKDFKRVFAMTSLVPAMEPQMDLIQAVRTSPNGVYVNQIYREKFAGRIDYGAFSKMVEGGVEAGLWDRTVLPGGASVLKAKKQHRAY